MPSRSAVLPFALNIAVTNAWVSQLFDQELRRLGVAPFQSGTLMMLHRLQPVTPSDLQAEMGVPPTTLRNRVNELVQAGLVERVRNPQDGRSHLLRTTTTAREPLRASEAAARRVDRLITKHGGDIVGVLPAGMSAVLDELRTLVRSLVADPSGSETTGPW